MWSRNKKNKRSPFRCKTTRRSFSLKITWRFWIQLVRHWDHVAIKLIFFGVVPCTYQMYLSKSVWRAPCNDRISPLFHKLIIPWQSIKKPVKSHGWRQYIDVLKFYFSTSPSTKNIFEIASLNNLKKWTHLVGSRGPSYAFLKSNV